MDARAVHPSDCRPDDALAGPPPSARPEDAAPERGTRSDMDGPEPEVDGEEHPTQSARPAPARRPPLRPRRWVLALTAVFLLALGARSAIVLLRPACDLPVEGSAACFEIGADATYFHGQGRALADGRGFVDPFLEGDRPSAGDPPLFSLLLGGLDLLGLDSVQSQRHALAAVGATSAVLAALVAASVAGRRAGVVAGLLAAFSPLLWINDGMLMSESPYVPLVALVLLASIGLWRRPTPLGAAVLGAAIGLAALTRGEAVLYLLVVVVPLVIALRSMPASRRLALGGVAWAGTALVLAPWLLHNAARFEEPVLLTSGTGSVLLSGSCDEAFDGPLLGYYSASCLTDSADRWVVVAATEDESVRDRRYRELAVEHLSAERRRVPLVAAARVGRIWEVYRFGDSIALDAQLERRGLWPSRAGFAWHWLFTPLAVAGLVVLRRRGRPISPFVGIAVAVTATAALSFAITRYRVPWDLCAVVLAAVALDAAPQLVAQQRGRIRARLRLPQTNVGGGS